MTQLLKIKGLLKNLATGTYVDNIENLTTQTRIGLF